MIGIIMAGGKSTRLGLGEKPLVEIEKKPLIDIVFRSCTKSKLEEVFVAVSENVPETAKHCRLNGYNVLNTSGKGYHNDIALLSRKFKRFVSVSVDIPFLTPSHINEMMKYEGSIAGCVFLGRPVPVGLNIVDRTADRYLIYHDPYIGINVNRKEDLERAKNIFSSVDPERKIHTEILE
ncbi:MAG: NTP transferase domain-containing protein [Candidatus Syntropharchaeia archaeon]